MLKQHLNTLKQIGLNCLFSDLNRNIKMKVVRDFGEYFKYSLHDARINKIEYRRGNMVLHFNYIFSYDEGANRF